MLDCPLLVSKVDGVFDAVVVNGFDVMEVSMLVESIDDELVVVVSVLEVAVIDDSTLLWESDDVVDAVVVNEIDVVEAPGVVEPSRVVEVGMIEVSVLDPPTLDCEFEDVLNVVVTSELSNVESCVVVVPTEVVEVGALEVVEVDCPVRVSDTEVVFVATVDAELGGLAPSVFVELRVAEVEIEVSELGPVDVGCAVVPSLLVDVLTPGEKVESDGMLLVDMMVDPLGLVIVVVDADSDGMIEVVWTEDPGYRVVVDTVDALEYG